jgi:hypothetical protein
MNEDELIKYFEKNNMSMDEIVIYFQKNPPKNDKESSIAELAMYHAMQERFG